MTTSSSFATDHEIPTVTNDTYSSKMEYVPYKILTIVDTVKEHYKIYEKYMNKSIDVISQWQLISNKIFGNIVLHDEGKNKLEFIISPTIDEAIRLVSTSHNPVIMVNENKKFLFAFSVRVKDLDDIIRYKLTLDQIGEIFPDIMKKRFLDQREREKTK